MTPRDAATVLLVRDGAAGVEALLMRRAAASPFMPDLCVFAGGRVDDADRDPGLADGGTAFAPFAVAAIREALEEAGVALVRGPAAARASLVAQRTAVAKGAVSLAAALAALDLRPDFDALVPFAHWVTPLFETRRYNTLFFAALATGDIAEVDGHELVEGGWVAPAHALAQAAAKQIQLAPPTVCVLRAISALPSAADVIAWARCQAPAPIEPELGVVDGQPALLLPGAPGHPVAEVREPGGVRWLCNHDGCWTAYA